MVTYVASKLMGSTEVLLEDNNMIVVKVGDVRVGGVYWQPEWRAEETDNYQASGSGTEIRKPQKDKSSGTGMHTTSCGYVKAPRGMREASRLWSWMNSEG